LLQHQHKTQTKNGLTYRLFNLDKLDLFL